MQAVQINEFGDSTKLALQDIPKPKAGRGELVVRVKFAGLNPADMKQREGLFESMFKTTFPSGLGSDFAGIVSEVGEGVTEFQLGDEVLGASPHHSAQAEYVLVPTNRVVKKPSELSWHVAASLFTAGTTAYACVEAVKVEQGDVVLISGASGSVGSIAAQLALLRGATVIGAASPQYHEWLKGRGIVPVDYHGDLEPSFKHIQPPLTACIDTTGQGYVELAVRLGIKPERINTIVDFSAAATYSAKTDGSSAANGTPVLTILTQYAASGKIDFPPATVFQLHDVQSAYRHMESKHSLGKVLLDCSSPDRQRL